eukprot:180214-Pleurochrysis_carterae.AAC.2
MLCAAVEEEPNQGYGMSHDENRRTSMLYSSRSPLWGLKRWECHLCCECHWRDLITRRDGLQVKGAGGVDVAQLNQAQNRRAQAVDRRLGLASLPLQRARTVSSGVGFLHSHAGSRQCRAVSLLLHGTSDASSYGAFAYQLRGLHVRAECIQTSSGTFLLNILTHS